MPLRKSNNRRSGKNATSRAREPQPYSLSGRNAPASENMRKIERHRTSRGFKLPEAGDDGIDFLQDKIGHMTYSRRIALYLGGKYSWYNPQLAESEEQQEGPAVEKPSIAKAWAFFEHVTLNRYEVPQDHQSVSTRGLDAEGIHKRCLHGVCRGERKLEMAEPGESEIPTKLYSAIHTPLSQLGDFGLGYGLYFSTLRAFAVLAFFAGIINIPNLMYFSSAEYDPVKQLSPLLQGSAICADRTWVPCPTCTYDQFAGGTAYPINREIFGLDTINGTNGTFLDVANYFEVTVDAIDWADSDLIYTDQDLENLYNDYQIRYVPGSPSTIIYEGYGSYECGFDAARDDCLFELIRCDSDECHPFLDLSVVSPMPPYGNAEMYQFALKNNCEGATRQQAAVNLATMLFFILGVYAIRWRQNGILVKFDEDEQTAQDYSINILNPPEHVHDPDEWKDFFEKNFDNCHVTVVTVDMDNDDILVPFLERREILRTLEVSLPEGTPLDMKSLEAEAEKAAQAKQNCLTKLISPSIPNLVARLKAAEDLIKMQLKKDLDFPVTNVFVTFETEAAQRDVLSKLTVGTVSAHNNDTSAISDPKYLFQGKFVLEVDEPEEPSSIRWQELNATKTEIVTRLVLTNLITLVLLLVGIVVIVVLYYVGPFVATTVTTIFTSTFPMIAKALTPLEYHRSESSRQKWMFIKIAVFNIALTTILMSLITPFLATLDQKEGSAAGLIPVVHGLFYSQILISPLIQLADPMGHLSRHFFAPRAKTQEAMNMNMLGSEIYLADRYANMIKFLYLMVWYCAVYPGAFFMGSIALFAVYFTDRFSLMRTWSRSPQVGSQIADFARNYFTPIALVLMAVMSAYFWSGFPYDSLCEDYDTPLDPDYVGGWSIDYRVDNTEFLGLTLYSAPNVNATFTIEPDAQVYKFCQQDLRAFKGRSFPPLPKWQEEGSEWMTTEQGNVLEIYGWISVVILAGVSAMFLYRIGDAITRGFRGQYQSVGKDMHRDYSTLQSIDSYVPQKKSPLFAYPLLLCDLKDIDPNLFSWRDPDKPHSEYSIFEDIKDIIDLSEVNVKHVFSDVKHWPPKKTN
mmetsp:Transcript_40564/g.62421  ORF Transcript_40564/g.62421 Transcript_40564/m.62421 type:complete len:1082 (-) Transcript_40564:80-3325(-)